MDRMSTIGHWLEQLERLGDWITRPLRWLVLLMVLATVVVVLLRFVCCFTVDCVAYFVLS